MHWTQELKIKIVQLRLSNREREGAMRVQRRELLLLVTLAAATATPVLGQTPTPAVWPADSGTRSAAAIPDFSGLWAHPFYPGFELPLSGPGPVTNRSRRTQLFDVDGHPRSPGTKPVLVDHPT